MLRRQAVIDHDDASAARLRQWRGDNEIFPGTAADITSAVSVLNATIAVAGPAGRRHLLAGDAGNLDILDFTIESL